MSYPCNKYGYFISLITIYNNCNIGCCDYYRNFFVAKKKVHSGRKMITGNTGLQVTMEGFRCMYARRNVAQTEKLHVRRICDDSATCSQQGQFDRLTRLITSCVQKPESNIIIINRNPQYSKSLIKGTMKKCAESFRFSKLWLMY